jgi:hypothetical protein
LNIESEAKGRDDMFGRNSYTKEELDQGKTASFDELERKFV